MGKRGDHGKRTKKRCPVCSVNMVFKVTSTHPDGTWGCRRCGRVLIGTLWAGIEAYMKMPSEAIVFVGALRKEICWRKDEVLSAEQAAYLFGVVWADYATTQIDALEGRAELSREQLLAAYNVLWEGFNRGALKAMEAIGSGNFLTMTPPEDPEEEGKEE